MTTETTLTAAAEAFERELAKYEAVADELKKARVSSEKTLHRTKRLLDESQEREQKLGELLQGLLGAMRGVQGRQQGCMEATLEAAKRVQVRANEFTVMLERFAKLGQRAHTVNEPVAAVMKRHAEGAAASEIVSSLQDVANQMEAVVKEADDVGRAAQAGDWPDVAREADALRQQVAAGRNKVLQLLREVTARVATAPS